MKRLGLRSSLATVAVLVTAAFAFAFYATTGDGSGSGGTTGTITAATISAPDTSSGSNTITWETQASLSAPSKNGQIDYTVRRSVDGGSFQDLTSGGCASPLDHGTASCTDVVATSGSYTYRVVATYSGWSATSGDETIVATVGGGAPAAPAGLSATAASSGSVSLSWTASTTSGVDGYNVYRSTTGAAGTFSKLNGATPVSATAYSDSTTAFDTAYHYKVRATKSGTESADSNTAAVTTVPAPPSSLSATAQSNGNVNLSWTASATSGVDGYDVYRSSTGASGSYAKLNGGAVSATSYVDTTSAFDTTYHYKVRAVKGGRESGDSNVASATTVPAAPSALSASAQANASINLSWTASATTGLDGYNVYRATSSDGPYAKLNGTAAVSGTAYSDTTTTPGTAYHYRVRAVKSGVESADSNTASATAQTPQLRMATGNYTGNGNDNRTAVNSLNFTPDLVIVKAANNRVGVMRTSTMNGDLSKPFAGANAAANAPTANLIQSLTSTGFTVGSDNSVNQNNVVYHWEAFKATDGALKVGTYGGTGTAQSVGGAGFQPEYAAVFSAGSHWAVQKVTGMTNSYRFEADAGNADRVTSLDSAGFSVGADTDVNASGTTYHYVLFNEIPGAVDAGTYTGNGSTQAVNAGFTPDYVNVRAAAGTKGVHRPITQLGTASLFFDSTAALAATGITALAGTGFTVGSDAAVNASNVATYYVAFKNTGS